MIDPASINLSKFLADWYGPPDKPTRQLPADYSWIPSPLASWYQVSSRWERSLVTLKKFYKPEEIKVTEGMAIFLEDPGEAIWAFNPDSPWDVYEGQLYTPWEKAREPLNEFLIHNAVQEAAYNATSRRSCDEVELGLLQSILTPMTEVAFGGWRWPRPGHRIFMNSTLIADIGPAIEEVEPWGDKPGYVSIQIGSSTQTGLAYLDEIHAIDWVTSGHRGD
ncbi:hypothetical protein [Streptomyces sp. NPDC058855]|uniref:hypothetical protein n=1 Tax=Streptomyces sp. NPDC058855 TaxID=3346651 RepID=UPI00367993E3